jgi:arylsulfatase A-like enzyme
MATARTCSPSPRRCANQKRLGVIPQDAKLTPWPDDLLKRWDTLSADEKKLFIRQADVFAAYFAYADHEIGRVMACTKASSVRERTLCRSSLDQPTRQG